MDSTIGALKNGVGCLERLAYGEETNASDDKLYASVMFSIKRGSESSLVKVKSILKY